MDLYFICIRSCNENPVFGTESDYKKCLNNLLEYRLEKEFQLKAYCLLPHSLKLIAYIDALKTYSEISLIEDIGNLKSLMHLQKTLPSSSKTISQCIKVDRKLYLHELVNYIENEPVRSGFVSTSGLYPFSSAYDPDKLNNNLKTHFHSLPQGGLKPWKEFL